jgi:DNA invertase Pin-like site-specific DNA recombinase
MLESFSEIMTLEENAKFLKIGKSTLYNNYNKIEREG